MKQKTLIGFVLGLALVGCLAGYTPSMHLLTYTQYPGPPPVDSIQPGTNDPNTVLQCYGSNGLQLAGLTVTVSTATPPPDPATVKSSTTWTWNTSANLLWGSSSQHAINWDGSFALANTGITGDVNSNFVASTVVETTTRKFLAADATVANTVFSNAGLLVNVVSGKKYSFTCVLYLSDSTAADGVKVDFSSGTATFTNIRIHTLGTDTGTALNPSSQVTAIGTVISSATFTGAGMYLIHGTMEPSSTGTFGPRFAQLAHTTGTVTLARGSYIVATLMQ